MAARSDTRAAKETEEPSVEDLHRQLEALRADVAALAETLKALGKSRARSAADGAREAGEAQAEALRRSLDDILEEADAAARHQPLTAMGLAAGLGFLIGLFLARR